MDKLFFVMPAYNEEDNIEEVVTAWYEELEKMNIEMEMLVIDDGSKDNTYNKLCNLKTKFPKLQAIHKENSGHGSTLLYGYKYALDNNANYIFQTDSDGQTLPSEFEEFWKQKEEYDMIIGSRKTREDGFSRKIVTKVLRLVVKIIFHEKVEDANTPYRLMKAETLKKYMNKIPKDFFLSNVLISVLFTKYNEKIKFIPITFRPRQGGVNSINIKRIFKIGIKALKDFSTINKNLKAN